LKENQGLVGFTALVLVGQQCFLLKQTVSYYASKDTPVFSAFSDASKQAFDKTNHSLLFAKLNKRRVGYLCA